MGAGRRQTSAGRRRGLGAALLSLAIVASLTGYSVARSEAAGAASVGTVTKAGIPIEYATSITAGPDGNLWFTSSGAIGRVTPQGAVTIFQDGIDAVAGIMQGPDGNLWFTNETANQGSGLGRITTAGVVTIFPLPFGAGGKTVGADGNIWVTSGYNTVTRFVPSGPQMGTTTLFTVGDTLASPGAIVAGPDGKLWISNRARRSAIGSPTSYGQYIVRITTDGQVDHIFEPVTQGDWEPGDITVGPDGNVWFVNEGGTGSVIRIANDVVTEFPFAGIDGQIVAGPDGNLWVGSYLGILRVTPSGVITLIAEYADLGSGDRDFFSRHIARGPDGALWYTSGRSIGRLTTAGAITRFPGLDVHDPQELRRGADGNLYFLNSGGRIGRVDPKGVVTASIDPAMTEVQSVTPDASGGLWYSWRTTAVQEIRHREASGATSIFTVPNGAFVGSLLVGPDGNLWFLTEYGTVGRMSPTGAFSFFPASGIQLTNGPDGNLWLLKRDEVNRMTTAGVVTMSVPIVGAATSLTAGPDGAMWVGRTFFRPFVSRILVTGVKQADFELPTSGDIRRMAAGPDGNLWVTQGGAITRITPAGALTTFPSSKIGYVTSLTTGADGALWFADSSIGRVDVGAPNPLLGAKFHAVGPRRVLDSRTSTGGWGGPLVAGQPRSLVVTGGDIPASASAVVLNLTATQGTAHSFLSTYPAGSPVPGASNLNFAAGQTIPNLATVKIGQSGAITIANAAGTVDVVADVVGYYDDGQGQGQGQVEGQGQGDGYQPTASTRILDSRTDVGGWNAPLASASPRELSVRGVGGVPDTASAVVANVTVTNGSVGSFVKLWASGQPPPATSNLNFGSGQTTANLTITPIGANGKIAVANAIGSVDVVVDVVGYYDAAAAGRFHALVPSRMLDDRVDLGESGSWGPGQTRSVALGGTTPVPGTATAVVMNATVTGGSTASFISVFGTGPEPPTTSTLNFAPGQTAANLTMPGLDGSGAVRVFNQQGSVHVIGDVVGYFTAD